MSLEVSGIYLLKKKKVKYIGVISEGRKIFERIHVPNKFTKIKKLQK